MSRSNPHENGAPNPAVRWFEWNGEQGTVRYYDKEQKKNIDVGTKFGFVLLDQLGSVRGWHEASQSGIYSNEVRDTRQDVLVVKAFKGGTLAEGLYKDIKDRINVAGGQFVANCYLAFKLEDAMAIGSLRFKGAALGAWMDFCKANRPALYKKAIEITEFTEGKKGRVIFRVPVLKIKELSDETNSRAIMLDQELQEFLTAYLTRTKRDQADVASRDVREPHHVSDEELAADTSHPPVDVPYDDDIPF